MAMNRTSNVNTSEDRLISTPANRVTPQGNLGLVPEAKESSSLPIEAEVAAIAPRNRYVAQVLRQGGLATLLLDLLTKAEEELDIKTADLRFNIGILVERYARRRLQP
jgi:hypothetical protein